MARPKSLSFDPLSLHAGQQPVPPALATPIRQIAGIVFKDTDHAAAVGALTCPMLFIAGS